MTSRIGWSTAKPQEQRGRPVHPLRPIHRIAAHGEGTPNLLSCRLLLRSEKWAAPLRGTACLQPAGFYDGETD